MTTTTTNRTKVAKAFKNAPRGKKNPISLREGDGLDVFDSKSQQETNANTPAPQNHGQDDATGAPEAPENSVTGQGQNSPEDTPPDTNNPDTTTRPESPQTAPEDAPGQGDATGAPKEHENFQDFMDNLQNSIGDTFPPDIVRAFAVSIRTRQPFLIIGETGTGKTTLVRAGAEYLGKTLYRVNLNGQTGREDLVGRYVLRNNATEWQDGLLVHAMRNGYWILLDELNAALPEVLFCLQAVTERKNGRLGDLVLTEHDGEVITPHPDFRIFATCNPPSYVGLKDLNTATLSRYIAGHMPMMTETDAVRYFVNLYPGVTSDDVVFLYSIVLNGLTLFQEGELSYCPSMRDIDHICAMVEGGLSLKEAVTFGLLHKVMIDSEKKTLQDLITKLSSEFGEYIQEMQKTRDVISHKQQLADAFAELRTMGGVPDTETIQKLRSHIDALETARISVDGDTFPF